MFLVIQWVVSPSSPCCRFNVTVEKGKTENYVYNFRVCREVDSSSHDFGGVVQTDRQTGKTTVIGRINETQVFNGSTIPLILCLLSSYLSPPDRDL